jgi:hypothetical protein
MPLVVCRHSICTDVVYTAHALSSMCRERIVAARATERNPFFLGLHLVSTTMSGTIVTWRWVMQQKRWYPRKEA